MAKQRRRNGKFARARRRGRVHAKKAARRISAAVVANAVQLQMITVGSVSSLAWGLLQRNVKLPGIDGVPNSLTYGAGTIAVGMFAGSNLLVQAGFGPLCAGLHTIGLKGLKGDKTPEDTTGGEFDALPETTGGEFDATEGEFEDVASGDFEGI